MISVAAFLYGLVDVFRRTPDDIINDLKGGNGAETLDMLKRLVKSSRFDADAETQAAVVATLEIEWNGFSLEKVADLVRPFFCISGLLESLLFSSS